MANIPKIDEATPETYAAIGFKSGLEVHQQLDTQKKLFCHCPVRPYTDEFHAEILRHMRPTLSELGEYDGTALMEFKTKKEIIYQINEDTVCTYEMDDTPPFELNQEALDIALAITMLLKCNLVSEIHIARKQYLDGSIPTGFQRTTILGVDGWIPYRGRRIGIKQLGLEEDACREVSDVGHVRTYRTDRLGVPLVETVTYPDMKMPEEVAEVAQMIRWLTRSTGRVRTGIGAGREDVNVSVEGGRRVEIKGVHRIPLIPLLVHNEAFRQVNLLEIQRELRRRGITPETFRADTYHVTDLLRGTQYYPVGNALQRGLEVRAVVLRGYRGILRFQTQPETTFAKEISDRVRVIACLDQLPNMVHSDMEGESLSSTEWTRMKKSTGTGDKDAVVIVWGNKGDVETGAGEIAIRAKDALDGVPAETRQALPDGTNGFERILPGPDRMYPDTDLPPLAISEQRLDRIRSNLPEAPWHREERYRKMGVAAEFAARLAISRDRDLFDHTVRETGVSPKLLSELMLSRMQWLRRCDRLPNFTEERFVETMREAAAKAIEREALHDVLEKTCGAVPIPPRGAAAAFKHCEAAACENDILEVLKAVNLPESRPSRSGGSTPEGDDLVDYLMGVVMERYRGRIAGREAAKIVRRFVSSAVGGET